MPNPEGFTAELKRVCAATCAEFGDPPCWRLPDLVEPCERITPCGECLAEVERQRVWQINDRPRYEPYGCASMPADCCDFAVIDHSIGQEICRCWSADAARRIARLLNDSAERKVFVVTALREEGR